MRKQPDGSTNDGHTDAYEQMVTTAEQIAWTHEFSDGIVRDSGDALLEFYGVRDPVANCQWPAHVRVRRHAGGGERAAGAQKSSRQEGREEDPGKEGRPPTLNWAELTEDRYAVLGSADGLDPGAAVGTMAPNRTAVGAECMTWNRPSPGQPCEGGRSCCTGSPC